jgi:hypothetical protein
MGSFFRSLGVGRNWPWIASLALLLLGSSPQLATAQEPVRDFSQLNTRLKPGDTIWVTDAQGREIKGKIRGLAPSSLTLDGGAGTMEADAVRLIMEGKGQQKFKGAMYGLAAGGGAAVLLLLAAGSCDAEDCEILYYVGAPIAAGAGAGIGVALGAVTHKAGRVVYRAPGAQAAPRLSVAPLVTPRARGVVISFAF